MCGFLPTLLLTLIKKEKIPTCYPRNFSLLAMILPTHCLAPIESDRRVGKSKISFQVCLMTPPCADLRLLAPCLPGMPAAASWPRVTSGSSGTGVCLSLPAEAAEDVEGSWGYCRGGGRSGYGAGELHCSFKKSVFISPACKDLEWFFSVSQETILIIWDRGIQCLSPDCPSRGCSFWLGNPLISTETPGTCWRILGECTIHSSSAHWILKYFIPTFKRKKALLKG